MASPSIRIERGDITKVEVDAIVNAANPKMLGGGGVDGAIHAAAGPELLAACQRIPKVEGGIRCPFGEARITPGFQLPARYVIHAVGPIYRRDPDPEATLRSAYAASLGLARAHGLTSVAFPAISTGAYGFPLAPAADIALTTAQADWGSVTEVRFVLFTEAVFIAFVAAAEALGLAD